MSQIEQTEQQSTQPTQEEQTPKQSRPSEYWLREIDAALKRERTWRKEAVAALKRYTLEGSGGQVDSSGKFNILWSNTETLRNAVYNQPPKPDVRQRWETQDPVALAVAEVLDRALTYTIERSGFDVVARRSVLDFLLPGRAVIRVRYVPHIVPVTGPDGMPIILPDGSKAERVAHESVGFEGVSWADFAHSDSKTWERVEWVAFRHYISKEDAKSLFPDRWQQLNYSSMPAGREGEEDSEYLPQQDVSAPDEARAVVWEVWDKRDERVYWVSRGASSEPGQVLLDTPAPLDFEGFFPVARPLYAIDQPDSLIPMPFYSQYKEQAEELDRISTRIKRMVRVIKWRGMYDASLGADLGRVMNEGEDGSLIPTDNAMSWVERGGLAGAVWLMPLDQAVQALDRLYQSRDLTKAVIYEITGISDILRGMSDPNETATAQNIKAAWGSSRVDGMKREIQRFFRDTLALAGEILGEVFQIDTLKDMTGMELPDALQKQQAQMAMQQMQAMQQQMQEQPQQPPMPGQPPAPKPQMPPEMKQQAKQAQEILSQPTWEEVKEVLSSDSMRAFKVDIETDSTIAPDQKQEMQAFGETMQMVGGLMQQIVPGMQQGVIPPDLGMALLAATIRKTPLANEMSGILQKYESELMQGNPMQKQLEAVKKENEQLKLEMKNKQGDIEVKAAAVQQKAQQAQGQQQIDVMDMQLRAAEMQERAAAAHVLPEFERAEARI